MINTPKQSEHTPRPSNLDIIRIDGRWAQAVSQFDIKFLDNGEVGEIDDWDDFEFTPPLEEMEYADDLLKNKQMNQVEFNRIHYARGEENMKGFVEVKGMYKKKSGKKGVQIIKIEIAKTLKKPKPPVLRYGPKLV